MNIRNLNKSLTWILIAITGFVLTACNEDPVIVSNDKTFNVDKFEQNIRAALDGQAVGYAFAININGQLAKSGDSGFARIQMDGQEMQSASKRMNIASITKTITAVAVLQLLERRGLTVDSLIAPWLPSSWILGPGVDSLTFRSLLTHRSGLNSADSNFFGTLTFSALRDSISTGVVNPKTYNYRNMNYALFRVIIPALWKGLPGAPGIGEINEAAATFFYRLYVQQEIMDKIGVMNADCINPPGIQPTLFYTAGTNAPGINFGDWTAICGGGGWYLSAIDLAAFMAHIRYNNSILSQANRNLMEQLYLGWSESNKMNGIKGEYYNHGGSITQSSASTGSSGSMRGLIVKYPNNVEAVLLINSNIASGVSIRVIMRDAYDNAWE
jgi:CubicO group peptidase (beta-lactamase class C family)